MGAPALEDAPSGRSGAVLAENCKILQLDSVIRLGVLIPILDLG
jgi:hypothetical protein